MKVTTDSFPDLTPRAITFAAFFPVELAPSELESKGKDVMSATWEAVTAVVKPRPGPARRDDDGDWSITWESGRREFRLDLQKRVVGATFELWADPKTATDLAKSHAATAVEKLGIRALSSLFIRYNHLFLLPEGTTNHQQILPRFLGCSDSRSDVARVFQDHSRIGRFDVNFSYRLDDAHYAFIKVELPANRDKRTVWLELAVRTRDEHTVHLGSPGASDGDALSAFIEVAANFYRGDYAAFVSSVLADIDVELLEQAYD